METTLDLKPRLTVIIPALRGVEAVARQRRAMQLQTRAEELEILLLCRSHELVPEGDAPNERRIDIGNTYLHQARAIGIQEARADYVMLAEDHCFPDSVWAAAMLDALDKDWDGVASAMTSGNPFSPLAQAAFVLGYGQWILPRRGPVRHLPGHNAVLRRSLLLERGHKLGEELLTGSLLIQDFARKGKRFWLETSSTMHHWDCSYWRATLITMLAVGAGFGAQRTRSWSILARLAYALLLPLIALIHLRRGATHFARCGLRGGYSPWLLLCMVPLALSWALGESIGSIVGLRFVEPWAHVGEIGRLRYVDPGDWVRAAHQNIPGTAL